VRRYFGRKLFTYTLTFFIAATIDWLIPRFMPGDPVAEPGGETTVVSAPKGSAALSEVLQHLFGLDKSLPEQFLGFWTSLLQGDLGPQRLRTRTPRHGTDHGRRAVHVGPLDPGHPSQLVGGNYIRSHGRAPEVA
jgi:peptide/nickel transport system permease protein